MLAIGALLAFALCFRAIVAPEAGAGPGCPSASVRSGLLGPTRAAAALRCLVNAERAAHGAGPVKPQPTLRRLAAHHEAVMLRTGIFRHNVPGDLRLEAGVARSAYPVSATRWRVGETLAWALAPDTTPAALFADLMRSPLHRGILLTPAFRDVGIAIVDAVPAEVGHGRRGVTATLIFGWTRRAGA